MHIMTVAELISELQKYPGDLPVVAADRWAYTTIAIDRGGVESVADHRTEQETTLDDAVIL
ncbi:hypothetical protein L5G32_09025 [Gordonia sp. HY002]|uniref:hypothetical protein n=1 Tax=Gordonia zhenghanii TaxID=2911516 RepID=UPI001EF0820F|nr:hypothetical protein [Gordonia zhenghanii]MCF8570406.1 hypothetical protein [Gordonia zhenghanii]MCF8604636.1 hypothetical protein [Gordonia zhenghanii]